MLDGVKLLPIGVGFLYKFLRKSHTQLQCIHNVVRDTALRKKFLHEEVTLFSPLESLLMSYHGI